MTTPTSTCRDRPPHPARGVVLVSKSAWEPAIRREHALTRLALEHGHPVWFVERPMDGRAVLSADTRGPWLAALAGRPRRHAQGALQVIPTSTMVPGHRGALAERAAIAHLRRALEQLTRDAAPAAVVANTPWQWPAVSSLPGVRRVFDGADDWRALLPERRERIESLYRRVTREADAIVLASNDLCDLFDARRAIIVPNGASDDVLATPPVPVPGARRLVYVGTLSPRFDAPFVAAMLRLLPTWRLALHGPCQYPGRGGAPGKELAELLDVHRDRVSWHGVIERRLVADAIDAGDVGLLPNRVALTVGQNSMKLYDYAARGRPIVATGTASASDRAAGIRRAATPQAAVRAVQACAEEPASAAAARRAWAATQRWTARWPSWSAAILGTDGRV